MNTTIKKEDNSSNTHLAESVWAVEYTGCISAKSEDPHPNKCPWYNTKQSDGEVPDLEILGMLSSSSLPLLPGPI